MSTDRHQDDSYFPRSIDINPTAKCNLHCTFCWGPDHSIPDGLTTEDWKRVIRYFARGGTSAIVFTGGEPLVRRDIGELVQFAKQQGLHVTLSTNALLLPRHAGDVLPFIDEIGIPLDGSTPARNSKMRLGNPHSFAAAINALHYVHANHPEIEVTVRTVVSKVNQHDILCIGETLQQHAACFDRWKIYQFTPVSIGARHREEHEISEGAFRAIAEAVVKRFPFFKVAVYPTEQRVGRYVFIGPEGDIFGVTNGIDYRIVGNVLRSTEAEIVRGMRELIDVERNARHAHGRGDGRARERLLSDRRAGADRA